MYLISLYQYCTVALAFLVGKPFRKSFYTNFYFTGILFLEYLACLCVTFNPFDWQFFYNQNTFAALFPIEMSWRTEIFIIAVINSVCTLVWERVVVKYASLKWKEHRVKKAQALAEEASQFSPDGTFIAARDPSGSFAQSYPVPEITLIKHEVL